MSLLYGQSIGEEARYRNKSVLLGPGVNIYRTPVSYTHLIFKGTAKRQAWHILNRMENVGGDLNAYTNKEETGIYSAFLTEHFGRAFELLVDIVFHSTFPQREIEKETCLLYTSNSLPGLGSSVCRGC